MSGDGIHDYLDGSIPRESVNAADRERLVAFEATLREASSALRSSPLPDFTEMVMAQLPPLPPVATRTGPGLFAGVARLLWRPVAVSFRPAYALAGIAAAIAALLFVPPLPPGSGGAPMAIDAGADSRMYVQFRIELPGASQVSVAGSFTGWQPDYELTEVSPGVWSAMVPLGPGVHDYTFVIDGNQMVIDPYAPRVSDSFGGSNSRLFLPAPNGSA